MRLFTHKGRKRRFSRGTATHRARAARASFVVGFRAPISSVRNYQLSLLLGHTNFRHRNLVAFSRVLLKMKNCARWKIALPVFHVNKLCFDVQHFPRFSLPSLSLAPFLWQGPTRSQGSREPWLSFVRVGRFVNVLRREIPPLNESTHRHRHGIRV